jgi:predicted  nucleic acid-binding Zn-ribbon protein
MQKELQKEFNQLIKEISNEVLELSVSKSIENASFTVKEQVPEMANQITRLNKALTNLQQVNHDLTKQYQFAEKRDAKIAEQMKRIEHKVDDDIKKVEKVIGDISSFQGKMHKRFDEQHSAIEDLEETTEKQTELFDQKLEELKTTTNAGLSTGLTTKTLLIWTLVFSVGSFGLLTTLLLQTLGVISL